MWHSFSLVSLLTICFNYLIQLLKLLLLTNTEKSFGALSTFPAGDSSLEMCSRVKPVGWTAEASCITRTPREPLNAQHCPGYTSG